MRFRINKRFITRLSLCVVLLVLLYAGVYEPRNVQLTVYHVAIPNLPPTLDGFKVVQLSDIHRRLIVPDSTIRSAVKIANSTHADVAVLTGDYVGYNRNDINGCFNILSKLKPRLGTYAVLGNHDYRTDPEAVRMALRAHGMILVDNANAKVSKDLYIAGLEDSWEAFPNQDAALEKMPDNAACIMLSHSPLGVNALHGWRGLLITGHTHGAQCYIPPISRDNWPGLLKWKYIRGWYQQMGVLMYVNRGIGMGNAPFRFLCRPEVTLYVLHPSKDGRTRCL